MVFNDLRNRKMAINDTIVDKLLSPLDMLWSVQKHISFGDMGLFNARIYFFFL